MKRIASSWSWFTTLAWALGALTAVTASSIGCGARASTAPEAPLPKAIHFNLPDLQGAMHKPEDYRGKVLFVDVWATWCEPCKDSLPYYNELQKRYGPKGLVIVGVNIDEEDDVVAAFLAQQPISFAVLRDPEQTLPAALQSSAMPAAYLLDRNGTVVWAHTTFRAQHKADIEAAIEHAVAQ